MTGEAPGPLRPHDELDTRFFDRDSLRAEPALWSARSRKGMVVAAHYHAAAAGAAMLARGGNAVDAAVATSLALGVCEPASSGLGGMGMMMLHLADGTTRALYGACRAPLAATPEEVARSPRYRGYRAVAVPALPALLDHVLARYGTLKVSEVLEPAIRLAEEGYRVSALQHRLGLRYLRAIRRKSAKHHFLGPDAKPLPPGTLHRQPLLARTLRRLASAGLADFFEGEVAAALCADMKEHGGFVTARDLKEARPMEAAPIEGEFGGWSVRTTGPPAGGRALLLMLHLAEELQPPDLDPTDPSSLVRLAAIVQRARRDRQRFSRKGAAAPDFAHPHYARQAAHQLRRELGADGETTHHCAVDATGNAVALTQSIERSFGSGEVSPRLGFLYNGYNRAFKVQDTRHPHFLRPGALARSNAAPTMLFGSSGRFAAALGSTGSERLVSGIFQTVLRLRSQPPFDAVHGARLHCTPAGEVLAEVERFPPGLEPALEGAGFRVHRYPPYAFEVGGLQLVVNDDGELCGVADPRRDGAALAP